MKKTSKSIKLTLDAQTIRTLENRHLTQAAGGILLTTSDLTRCRACDSWTVPVTRCM